MKVTKTTIKKALKLNPAISSNDLINVMQSNGVGFSATTNLEVLMGDYLLAVQYGDIQNVLSIEVK